LKQQLRSNVHSAFAVLTAERLARRTKHEQIDAERLRASLDYLYRIRVSNIALNEVDLRMVHPVGLAGDGVIIQPDNYSKSPRPQCGGHRPRTAKQIDGYAFSNALNLRS